MSPVWMIEGRNDVDAVNGSNPVSERNVAERRLAALAAAVREHESVNRHRAIPTRPQDIALYRRLRQICGERDDPDAYRRAARGLGQERRAS